MAISASLVRIGAVTLNRNNKVEGNWLLPVPEHAIQALNKSLVGTGVYSGSLLGTSFEHNASVTLWMVGGGTSVEGTGFGFFVGTGAV